MTVKYIDGPTIALYSGHYFHLENPSQSRFDIEDIAHALSNICRFTGHSRDFYSVAQHSVLVSKIVPPEHALAGLLHDAAEAFIGDVSKPLKSILPEYQVLEKRIEAAIFERFGLPPELDKSIKTADLILLRTEQRDLMGAGAHDWAWTAGIEPLADVIQPMCPKNAKAYFLNQFYMFHGL